MTEHRAPIIGFVWRSQEMVPQVTQMALHTGSRAIFDFSMLGVAELLSLMRKADPVVQVRDIKISAAAWMESSLEAMLKEAGAQNIWVECHPGILQADTPAFLQRLKQLSKAFRCFPIIGEVNLLKAVLADRSEIERVVLKGCEASGFVSRETTLTLYSMVREMLRDSATSREIIIWGGVSTPDAAAAFLSTGAAGIVFESLHWLTDLVAVDDLQRRRLSNLHLDATDLVGLDLQTPCRLFTKGNSIAFREIKRFERVLCGANVTAENRRSFLDRVMGEAVHPLESPFTLDDTTLLGVEAAFAGSFAERFGTKTEAAVKSFMDEIRGLCRLAEEKKNCFLDNAVARELGVQYPFIQGAMSWITDLPDFALRVAEAGALPTIALGMMDAQALDRRLGNLPEIMGGRPYAVNFISLAENPFRQSHLAWLKKHKPRFVVIAGGDLSSAKELMEGGLQVIYIAPDEALLGLALDAGVQYVICEGYEAGGHVGRHSTLTLAQRVLDLKRLRPALFQNVRIILAGGIFDRQTAFMAAMLGADAIQMGTAYLATREIVETGALSAFYQRLLLASLPGTTVVSGRETGLWVRSLRTPQAAAVLSLEREFAAGRQDERSFRMRIEEMTAGSLFTAARGLDKPGGAPLDEQACLERGQFMSGACAGLIRRPLNLPSFHRELAEGPLFLHQPPQPSPDATTPSPKMDRERKPMMSQRDTQERIAITGMGILNTLGKSPEEVWASCLAMKSGITPVPPSRWDHRLFYDPSPFVPDKTYCKVGAFLDFQFSRTDLGISPHDFRTMTEATKFTLWLADKAIRASGILESNIARERIAVLISQNSGEAAGTLTNFIIRAYFHDILAAIKKAVDLTPDQEIAIEREVKSGRMAPDDTTLLGRLNCAAAGFVCNRYGFMGPSHSVSAACATSLVALHSAIQMIRNGIIDAAIVGGGEEKLSHLHFLEFSALGALYGLSGQERPAHETSRPFDAERDGMVLGEGGGMIVIERESLARARGAHVHAVITGMGASNNHQGMVEASSDSQELAIRASFRDTPYGPEAVDLVECHATSTRQGDAEEVHALKSIFDTSKRTVLTAFKSQIGHTLGASGINSLIRGVMAMKAGVFPPTLNYCQPDPEIDLAGSGLFIPPGPLNWECSAGRPRRLQVNAFGFGGSNYVVQLEQAMDAVDTVLASPGIERGLARAQGDSASDLKQDPNPAGEAIAGPPELQGLSFFRVKISGHDARMAVVAESEAEARTVIEKAPRLSEAGIATPKSLRSLSQQGIFLGPEDLPTPPLAYVFPGQGTHYAGMGRELYGAFPVIRQWMDRLAAAADFDLLHLLFHDHEENLQKTRWQQPALFVLEHAIARYLLSLGIYPQAVAGHSLGELTALCLAGVYSPEDGFRIVNKRALCMDKATGMHTDPGVMMATDAPLALLKELIEGREEDVYVSNVNSPRQVVLSGKTEGVKNFGDRLKQKGYMATLLRVSMAFHSPIMRVIHDELEAFIATIVFHSPQIPVISNTTMAPYPSDPGEIKRILMAHLESPVHWMNNVQTLWNDYGVRHFLEVGPGDILSSLIADTFSDSVCIQTCLPGSERLTCRTALARLFAHGHLKFQKEPGFVFPPEADKASNAYGISRAPSSKSVALGLDGPTPPPALAPGEGLEIQEHMEAVIRIIMDATGFERDEIQPDMDLRNDLSIRSIRLPVIMDAAEQHFGITIEFQDFTHVRTVKDIAQRISEIIAREQGNGSSSAATGAAPGEGLENKEYMEAVIRIIMDATGFERDEIQPDMDLRNDLSIRSIRLPVIMDAAEQHFGITIEFQDFTHVRTVKDIAQRISEIIAREQGNGSSSAATGAAPGDGLENKEHMEAVIRIIMDATGFERDEIQPDMDLRNDLSIRSIRLPIIMDAAEQHFGITIEFQDFTHVRTVKDIAQRISEIIAREQGNGSSSAATGVAPGAVRDEAIRKPSDDEADLKRLVFRYIRLDPVASDPLKLAPDESVLLLSPEGDDRIAARAGEIFRQEHGVHTIPVPFLQASACSGKISHDIRTAEGARDAADRIAGLSALAGMMITLSPGMSENVESMGDVSRLLRGIFILLKVFLQAPDRKFVVLLHSTEASQTPVRLAVEGVLGLFLSAAQEYPKVQFRTLEIDRDTDLRGALSDALDRGYPMVEMAHRDGSVFTSEGHVAPLRFRDLSTPDLNPGEVVVISGGATGIGAHLARSLAPFKPHLVLLGRTPFESGLHAAKPHPANPPSAVSTFEDRALEIGRTLADLRASGIEASYHTCDVADPAAVRAVMDEVVNRFGKIRGIIHGAGILRDGLLSQMTPDDFSTVTDIKFLGAWNLFLAAEKIDLRFFVGLSSVASIQGNPGQANYAAANRMMSALIRSLRRKNAAIRFKALMLPPIEGAGMAENPDIRELMKRMGASYIHVNELAGLFCRELFVSPDDDDWIMFMRKLPSVKTAKLDDVPRPLPNGELEAGVAAFSPENFPMIERISSLDIRREHLEAVRSFSREKDLWIEDHRPFKFVKYPLVSAAMLLETFMEAARILYPYLAVRGVRQVRFLDLIQCPAKVSRVSLISCRRSANGHPEVLCDVSLATQALSPTGRLTERFTPHCMGQVILDGGNGHAWESSLDFPVRPDELRTPPMDHRAVRKWYKKHSGLKGRYRVLERLEGAGPGVVRGRTTYQQTVDFANLCNPQYLYSPYLLEALLQLTGFYCAARQISEKRTLVPVEIGEMRLRRKCRVDEQIVLEARMQSQNEQGFTWDARGVDDQGHAIMQVSNMRMNWVAD